MLSVLKKTILGMVLLACSAIPAWASNDYYTHGSFPATGSSATSASMRAELDLISAGFDKLPGVTSNGSKAVVVNSGGTALTVTTGTLTLSGNLNIAAAFTTSGAYSLTLTTTAATNVTLPTTGTLATLAGTETLTNKTLTSPTINSATVTGTLTWSPTITGHLLFTDATYDIGASGATRPRDFYLSRNATLGGTLAVTGNTTLSGTLGVTGNTTLSGTLAVTGNTTLSGTGNNVGTITTGTWNGTAHGVQYGGTGSNMSATGGTSNLVKQTSAGAAFTAAVLTLAELSQATTYKLLQISRDMTSASGSVNTAHGVSGTPKLAIFFVAYEGQAGVSLGLSNGSTHYRVALIKTTGHYRVGTTNAVYIEDSAGVYQSATASFDSTNLTLAWTKSGSPPAGTAELIVLLLF